jgi:O-antigen ligase
VVSGFFANRNHLATLILSATPFAVVLGAGRLRRRGGNVGIWLSALFLGLALVGLAVVRSRFGVLLFGPMLGASLLAAWIASGRSRPPAALLGLVGTAAVAAALVAGLALGPIMARFDTGTPELRFERWSMVAEAAGPYLPLGTGVGSFDAVYRAHEPLEQLDSTFFNHAHNEYLETWLEAGWPGIALIIAFLVWYARRAWATWVAPPSRAADLGRAASIAIGMMLLHSIADYPLRTAALAVLFALCCARNLPTGRADSGLSQAAAVAGASGLVRISGSTSTSPPRRPPVLPIDCISSLSAPLSRRAVRRPEE